MNVRDFVVGSLAAQRARKKLARERVTRCETDLPEKRVRLPPSTKRSVKLQTSHRLRQR